VKKGLIVLSVLAAAANQAQAQSNVILYGIVDAGVTYYNKAAQGAAKGSALQMDTGVAQGNRLGFKGTEDLGGGVKALFVLENGFNLDTGTIAQGGVFFGRLATVGLSGNLGSVTMGRQYDFMAELGPFALYYQTPAGLSAAGLPVGTAILKTTNPVTGASILGSFASLSNRVWGERLDNSIKYSTPSFNGLTFGVLYAFGEVAGNTSANRSLSFGTKYAQGPIKAAASYTAVNNSTGNASNRVWGLGGSYDFGSMLLYGNATRAETSTALVRIAPTQATTYEIGSNFTLSAAWVVGAGYQYQQRNNHFGSAQQVTLFGDYYLSKRTDLYSTLAYGKDNAFDPQTTQVVGLPSYDHNQAALRVGVRHRF
jgi:predicted porin